MLSVGGYSPYECVYGRTPGMLPQQPDSIHEESLPRPGTIRHTHRIREISMASMIRASANQRAERALNTRTLPAGESFDYKNGDIVDFHRKSPYKDVSGWHGPAKVVDASHPQEGNVTIRYKGLPFECRFQDLRKHQNFMVFLAAPRHSALQYDVSSWDQAKRLVANIATNRVVHLGRMYSREGWRISERTNQSGTEWPALCTVLKNLAATQFRFQGCDAVRISKGSAVIPAVSGFSSALTLWWIIGGREVYEIHHDQSNSNVIGKINMRDMEPSNWSNICVIQFLRNDQEFEENRFPET